MREAALRRAFLSADPLFPLNFSDSFGNDIRQVPNDAFDTLIDVASLMLNIVETTFDALLAIFTATNRSAFCRVS